MKRFISVTKPGIIFGNAVALLGGYFLAHPTPTHWLYFITLTMGISLVIASGCVFNNYIDRDIDRLMERTKNRVLAKDELSHPIALLYAALLGIVGFGVLYYYTNALTLMVTAVGYVIYAGIYTLLLKRRSLLSTPIGAISGAVPPVAGYCAVTHQLDAGALVAFFILFFWQLPHFYAIAIYRLNDFAAVALPVLPLRKNIRYTQWAIVIYILIYTLVTLLPSFTNHAGKVYFVVALILGLLWFALGIKGFSTQEPKSWSRKMFLFSIINLMGICLTLMMVSLYWN